ncbi:NrfD/PsrC family molybdoenzyme membrane anchor subunit [Blastococcus brunescens]|uniref:NrfD/PsrC family molybdoenzyme membrane anchor subunit n=1 Tax=Blastococcus brunescens TaxID=1564165 RepID=A0ABZ1B2A0_9ACTN|nr:NrfD/PsrC family molybdoenzyme membrane anchor subunit [Blastococcus sp. BMG 8361]WRL64281.1 NrfD/PsrC family molybdoenzyme membrane anchor subunit [Blastococcus sp. BMG 8361]
MADLTGRPALTRVARYVAGGGSIASVGFLIHDLGRPERFLHMLRVFKPTSPLSVGTYILSPFSAAAGATAAVELLGWFPRLKRFGGIVAGLFGGPMATYTAVLLTNTAVPSWHDFHTKLPFVFAGSAMAAGEGCAWCSRRSRRRARRGRWRWPVRRSSWLWCTRWRTTRASSPSRTTRAGPGS